MTLLQVVPEWQNNTTTQQDMSASWDSVVVAVVEFSA